MENVVNLYNTGDYVVYRYLNVCKVVGVEKNVFECNGKEYYKLNPISNQDTGSAIIYVPMAFDSVLRHVLDKSEVNKCLADIGKIKPYIVIQKKPTQIISCYEEIIESGDIYKYLALIKGIISKEKDKGKKISEIELRYKAKVEKLILMEFALVLNKEFEQMKEILMDLI